MPNTMPNTIPPASSHYGTVAHVLPAHLSRTVAAWIDEDAPAFDYGGFVVGDAPAAARLLMKEAGILAGRPFFDEVFRQLACRVEWHVAEGHDVGYDAGHDAGRDASHDASHDAGHDASHDASHDAGSAPPIRLHCATVTGPARQILLGERVALNTIARCSGIATAATRLLRRLRRAGYGGILAGTRKTTPGFRLVEKYALLLAGCDTHRHDLSSMAMLKDNHIWLCQARLRSRPAEPNTAPTTAAATAAATTDGSAATAPDDRAVAGAVAAARAVAGFATKIEVECQSYEQADAAIRAGADVVMLDNMSAPLARSCADRLRAHWTRHDALIEISGGLTPASMEDYAAIDSIDIMSTSSIHQGVRHVDFSLKIIHPDET